MFDTSYMDSFDLLDAPAQLVNFANGGIASPEIQNSLFLSIWNGTALAKTLVEEHLVVGKDGQKKSFYDKLSRSPLKTMAEMKRNSYGQRRDVSQAACLNSMKKVTLKRVFFMKTPWCPRAS